VCAGDGVVLPDGTVALNDVLVRTLFGGSHGELTPDHLRETLIMVSPHAAFRDVSGLVVAREEVISIWRVDGEPGPAETAS
jgi:hypothetical protein